jgi:RND family efflux transporter MFP subunit
MKKFFIRSVIAVAIILVGIGATWWYVSKNRMPMLGSHVVTRGNVVEAIDEPGTVVAENKAGLSFQEAGQISSVDVKEGDAVKTGATLAHLNSATMEANLEQANAAVAAAQAKLDGLQIGATPQAIAVSQAALAVAQQALLNSYATVQNTLADAYAKGNDAVTSELAPFFTGAQTDSVQFAFQISDSQLAIDIVAQRVQAGAELASWMQEDASIADSTDTSQLDQALSQADGHLAAIQTLLTTAVSAVADNTNLSAAIAATYRADASAGLSETNVAIAEVRALEHTVAAEKATVVQAQAQLNLTTASATSQDIEAQQAAVKQAQAAVAAVQVALDNAALVAPFSGTVQDLTAQVGQVVSPGQQVLSLVNNGGIKIQTYVSEADVARIKVGDAAAVTLDAFGTGTVFPATITTIDGTETPVNGTPSYLITLHFAKPESQVRDGMTGNVHVVLAEHDDVIVVPSRLVLNDDNRYEVLVQTPAGIERRQVQIGLVGDDGMTEITSGIDESDTLANF